MIRYMKLPKKKDNEKLRKETSEDLYAMRKTHHQVGFVSRHLTVVLPEPDIVPLELEGAKLPLYKVVV